MKFFVFGAAAILAATLAVPATAQVVVKERTVIKQGDDGWRRHRADCRIVKVKTRLPNGNVIIKTRRHC